MKPERIWPIAIVAVLGATVAVNVALVAIARDRNAAVIEPDYYRKAVRWDSTLAEERKSADLGWRLDAALGPVGADGARLDVRLTDRDGAPLDGATVRVAAVHNTEADHVVAATLLADGPGAYSARLPLRHLGQWELRFAVSRGGAHFTAAIRREAGWVPSRP